MKLATEDLRRLAPEASPRWGKVSKGLGHVAVALEVAGIGIALYESGRELVGTMREEG